MRIKRSLLCISTLLTFSSVAMSSSSFDQEKASVARSVPSSQRSFLGVELGEVTRDTVQRLKLKEERGALIEEVTAGSSAAEAGLLKNDVIVRWDGESIESAREVSRRIRETPAGRTVRLSVFRDGREIDLNVKLGEPRAIITRPRMVRTTPIVREQLRAEIARVREEARTAVAQARQEARATGVRLREEGLSTGRLGVQLQSMTPQLAEYFGLSKRSGALVVFVYADSAAAKAGLKAGDVILSAGSKTVETPMDLRRALVEKQEGSLELRILRDKQEQSLTVQIDKRIGSLNEDGDCVESIVRGAVAPLNIDLPEIALAPMAVQVPRIALNPIVIQVPSVNIDPIVVPAMKLDISPMKVTIPKIKTDPVKVVIVPRRIEL